jgi:predicted nucleic acid-binding protein
VTFVVDASVVVKWVVEEAGTAASLALRRDNRLVAPDLVIAECANILWKKARRGELSGPQASMAARLLERSGLELIPMRGFMADATNLALELSHPAYDCIYLAVAGRAPLAIRHSR